MSGARPRTTGYSLRPCSTASAPVSRGAICPSGSAVGSRSTPASAAGPRLACGSACSSTWRLTPTTSTDDRQHDRARSSARGRRPQKLGEDQAIGRSKGGLTTKIHATVDALGNPTGFHLTGGQADDLAGADALLPALEAETLIADKAFDADQRVLEPLADAGKTAVIPPRKSRTTPRAFDKDLYSSVRRELMD